MIPMEIDFILNGRAVTGKVSGNLLLADYLREHLDLKGAKIGCSRGACGSCTVLVNNIPIAACSYFAFQLDGKSVLTIEGLERDTTLHDLQQAFIEHAAFQCGYCTSGMILVLKAMLDHEPNPSRDTVVEWISSNICRCTGYAQIIAAAEAIIAMRANTGPTEAVS